MNSPTMNSNKGSRGCTPGARAKSFSIGRVRPGEPRAHPAYRMKTSIFDLFKIGIGPSSSHTVGPMRAAERFAAHLEPGARLSSCVRVQAELFGSLALTGIGHGTDRAVILGLSGE